MTAVSITNLSKTYQGAAAAALDSLTLDIPSGGLVALLGPSGCGKTTALKLIAGLLHPDSGDVRLDGRPILADPPEQRGAVMVFQNHLLFPHMTVADNIGFGLRMRGLPGKEVRTRVEEMLEMVRLPDLGGRMPSALSGGQQQRVALARALIIRPKVLLLDEPLANLDAHLRAEMRDLIRDLQQSLAITTLFVTHDHQEAVVLADRIALILDGRLAQYDTAATIYARPADERVARFFGGRNFVPGTSVDGSFHAPLGQLLLPPDARAGNGILTFRPESVAIASDPFGENVLSARVTGKTFLGTQTQLSLLVGETPVEATLPPGVAGPLTPGDSLRIQLPWAALWVLPPPLS